MWKVLLCEEYVYVESSLVRRVPLCEKYPCAKSTAVRKIGLFISRGMRGAINWEGRKKLLLLGKKTIEKIAA
jgi:hypothetical protein